MTAQVANAAAQDRVAIHKVFSNTGAAAMRLGISRMASAVGLTVMSRLNLGALIYGLMIAASTISADAETTERSRHPSDHYLAVRPADGPPLPNPSALNQPGEPVAGTDFRMYGPGLAIDAGNWLAAMRSAIDRCDKKAYEAAVEEMRSRALTMGRTAEYHSGMNWDYRDDYDVAMLDYLPRTFPFPEPCDKSAVTVLALPDTPADDCSLNSTGSQCTQNTKPGTACSAGSTSPECTQSDTPQSGSFAPGVFLTKRDFNIKVATDSTKFCTYGDGAGTPVTINPGSTSRVPGGPAAGAPPATPGTAPPTGPQAASGPDSGEKPCIVCGENWPAGLAATADCPSCGMDGGPRTRTVPDNQCEHCGMTNPSGHAADAPCTICGEGGKPVSAPSVPKDAQCLVCGENWPAGHAATADCPTCGMGGTPWARTTAQENLCEHCGMTNPSGHAADAPCTICGEHPSSASTQTAPGGSQVASAPATSPVTSEPASSPPPRAYDSQGRPIDNPSRSQIYRDANGRRFTIKEDGSVLWIRPEITGGPAETPFVPAPPTKAYDAGGNLVAHPVTSQIYRDGNGRRFVIREDGSIQWIRPESDGGPKEPPFAGPPPNAYDLNGRPVTQLQPYTIYRTADGRRFSTNDQGGFGGWIRSEADGGPPETPAPAATGVPEATTQPAVTTQSPAPATQTPDTPSTPQEIQVTIVFKADMAKVQEGQAALTPTLGSTAKLDLHDKPALPGAPGTAPTPAAQNAGARDDAPQCTAGADNSCTMTIRLDRPQECTSGAPDTYGLCTLTASGGDHPIQLAAETPVQQTSGGVIETTGSKTTPDLSLPSDTPAGVSVKATPFTSGDGRTYLRLAFSQPFGLSFPFDQFFKERFGDDYEIDFCFDEAPSGAHAIASSVLDSELPAATIALRVSKRPGGSLR